VSSWWARWRELDAKEQGLLYGLALCGALYLVHYTIYSFWFIEDAAISFAFARNLVAGEGFVAYPGGERVEGFSNPSWTLLLAAAQAVGVTPWISAKLFGMVFGLGTLGVAFAWARRMIEPQHPSRGALLAPLLLAVSPQFVLWNASGLENSVFSLLLALGAWRTLVETREGGRPLSALAWALLAMTRPEAPMYAAMGGLIGFGLAIQHRGRSRALRWGVAWNAVFAVVFGGWYAWRFAYFAWPFPNTYYAKLSDGTHFEPLSWNGAGWKYLRGYALYTGHGFLLPVYALGQTGLSGRRGTVGLVACAAGVVLLSTTFAADEPAWWVAARVGFLAVAAVGLPLVGVGRPGQAARSLAWYLGALALFFALYSGGDWMRGFRWLSMASVPMAVLLADAVLTLGAELRADPGEARWRRRLTWGIPRGLMAYALGASVVSAGVWLGRPETSPYDVHFRVQYMQQAAARLHLDHVSLLEVDMGAHMWWSGFELVDIAGLVDVPMAHHAWEDAFVADYVYAERHADFEHVHPTGGWGDRAHLRKPAGWRDYLEIPAYPISPRMQHVGNNVRKDLFVRPSWEGTPGRVISFAPAGQTVAGVTANLEGWDVVAPEVMPGGEFFLEVGLRRLRPGPDLRLIAFLREQATGRVQSWELPPGYDWLPQSRWTARDVVVGRHALSLPADLQPGRYDLGFVVLAGDLGVLAAADASPDPVLAWGERRFPGAIDVVPAAQARSFAQVGLDEARTAAGAGACERAERRWMSARRHLAEADPWQRDASGSISVALARCYGERAGVDAEDALAEADIVAARRWDHRQPVVQRVGVALADRWEAAGDQARAGGDAKTALAMWTRALRADPTRSWVRRRAEAARDEVLGLYQPPKEAE